MSEEKTIETIRGYSDELNNTFVNFSGGRYSLVALHLALRAVGEVKAIYVDTTISLPECNEYVKELCDEWGVDLTILERKDTDFWRLVRKKGFPFFNARWCMEKFKFIPLRIFNKVNNLDCLHLTGINKEESKMRNKIYNLRGMYHFNYNIGSYVLHPILNWSKDMIEKYIEKNDLPINPCYTIYGENGNCYYCPYIKRREYYIKLSRLHPDLFQNIVNAELAMRNKGSAIYHRRGKRLYISKLVAP